MIEDKSKIFAKSLTLQNHLFIVLMKLKLGLFNRDISIRFGIETQLTSKIYRYSLPLLAKELAFLIVWPEREKNLKIYLHVLQVLKTVVLYLIVLKFI